MREWRLFAMSGMSPKACFQGIATLHCPGPDMRGMDGRQQGVNRLEQVTLEIVS